MTIIPIILYFAFTVFISITLFRYLLVVKCHNFPTVFKITNIVTNIIEVIPNNNIFILAKNYIIVQAYAKISHIIKMIFSHFGM